MLLGTSINPASHSIGRNDTCFSATRAKRSRTCNATPNDWRCPHGQAAVFKRYLFMIVKLLSYFAKIARGSPPPPKKEGKKRILISWTSFKYMPLLLESGSWFFLLFGKICGREGICEFLRAKLCFLKSLKPTFWEFWSSWSKVLNCEQPLIFCVKWTISCIHT